MDIDAIYQALVDGTREPGDLEQVAYPLFRKALEHTRNPDPVARLGALRVAASVGPEVALPVIRALVVDHDPRVRTWAFNQAVAAKEQGIAVLRDAAHGTDNAITAAALELLEMRMDRPSAGVGRRGLRNADASVRVAGARLLGRVAGPAVTVELRRAVEGDADPGVRAAAVEALARIAGDLPRGEPENWWDEPGGAIPAPPVTPQEGPPDVAWTVRAPPEPLAAEEPTRDLPVPTSPPPSAPSRPAPAPPAPPAPPPVEQAWDGQWASLPATLPTEFRALIRLLGMVGPGDRGAVLAPLAGSSSALGDLLGAWRPNGDAAQGRGLALAVAGLRRNVGLTKVRQMTSDPQPTVRAAAAEAIGALGAASTIPALMGLLGDDAPEVQSAAATALATLTLRIDRADLARDAFDRLGEVADEVQQAVDQARSALDA